MPPLPQIHLTEVEQELKTLLLDVAKHINPDNPSELRFTGGWVRDKLLGVPSYDIDVAINDTTGYQFALRMKDYLDLPGKAAQYRIRDTTTTSTTPADADADARHVVRDLHKIEANPDKSKHLETVTTKIFGLDIDIVNLRRETYTSDSRNPQMEFGSPAQDALRRDATINAMFYNLQTGAVEDLTRRGWDDMQARLIRTPLDAFQTFEDDPLRVLRLVRFASRLGYALDGDVERAARDGAIKAALARKISRERVGVEVDKMLLGPDPLGALAIIDRLGLFATIFTDPEREHGFQPEVDRWPAAYTMAGAIARESEPSSSGSLKLLTEDEADQKYYIYLLSAVVPWFDAPTPQPTKSTSKAPPPVAVQVFRGGIKASNKLSDVVLHAVANAEEIAAAASAHYKHACVARLEPANGGPAGRDTLGMLVRKWGPTWKAQVAFAMVLEASRSTRSQQDIIKEYAALLARITEANIQAAHAFKPVIDGHALAKALDARPGPWMKPALEEIMAWQLGRPDDATPEAALAALASKTGELPARLVAHLLSLTVRPLFTQTRSPAQLGVTPAGRLATSDPASRRARSRAGGIETQADAEAQRPWKQARHADALDLLGWCVGALDAGTAREHWALLVPTVLALVDDVDVRFKCRGCRLLAGLLRRVDPAHLERTGLSGVFDGALAPCLSYLPTLTAEEDAVAMLGAAYPALLALAAARHPDVQGATFNAPREAYIADILHKHLLAALARVEPETYPALTACLLEQLGAYMRALGLGTVAHLQYVVPAVRDVLATPFGGAAPEMLVAAARALDTLMESAAPRVWRWRADVLAGLCAAWLGVEDETAGVRRDEVRAQLRKTVDVLRKVVAADVPDLETELEQVVAADGRLAGLVRR